MFHDKRSNHRAGDRHNFPSQIYLLRELQNNISLNKFGGITAKLFNVFCPFFCVGPLLCLNDVQVVQDLCNNRCILGFRSLETSSWWDWWLCCLRWTYWSSQPGTSPTPSGVHNLWLLLSRYCLFIYFSRSGKNSNVSLCHSVSFPIVGDGETDFLLPVSDGHLLLCIFWVVGNHHGCKEGKRCLFGTKVALKNDFLSLFIVSTLCMKIVHLTTNLQCF